MDASTEELRRAHDAIAEFYAERLPGIYEQLPVDRAVLDLFCTLVLGGGRAVADVGCGPGALVPYLAARGLEPHGVDLSPEMVRVARRDHPGSRSRSATSGACRSRTRRSTGPSAGTR